MRKMLLKPLAREALLLGLVLTGLQIGIACMIVPGRSVKQAYSSLCKWDCQWYEGIARTGYHSTVPPVAQEPSVANVAFFPGYPYLGRALYLGLGVDPRMGLLLISQIFCVLFWTALWLLLRRWKVAFPLAALVVLAVIAHPAALFLVCGYSESMFLSCLLFFILTVPRRSRRSSRKASLVGIVMSSTRIVGLPASIYPIAHRFFRTVKTQNSFMSSDLIAPIFITSLASFGALSFLLYCQIRFGRFNLYMETQKIGWGIVPDYGALFKWLHFQFRFKLDRVATLMSGFAFVVLPSVDLFFFRKSRASGIRRRLPVYCTAFVIFFITLSGLKSNDFISMIRYTLPWYILLSLCVAQLSNRFFNRIMIHISISFSKAHAQVIRGVFGSFAYTAVGLVVLGFIWLFYFVQLPHAREFLKGQWFA